MSSGEGRQSPDPESQTKEQLHQAPASNPNKQGGAPSLEHGKEASEQSKTDTLESNPKGPLEDAAKEKTSKN